MASAGCAVQPDVTAPAEPAAAGETSASSPAPSAAPSDPGPAREGRTAASERIRFVPTLIELPGHKTATVEPEATVDGQLTIPSNVEHVGWWDGSAWVNDPFGNTVIAGHVDSVHGFGFFARLLLLKKGERVTVSAGHHRLTYQVSRVQSVARRALASDTAAFDQTGDHRLILITCTGAYDRGKGGYEQNLVVTAVPVGSVR